VWVKVFSPFLSLSFVLVAKKYTRRVRRVVPVGSAVPHPTGAMLMRPAHVKARIGLSKKKVTGTDL
jgi:hypothetical protein